MSFSSEYWLNKINFLFQVIWLKMCNYCETKRSLVLIYMLYFIYIDREAYICLFIICLYLPSVTGLFSVAFHSKSQFTKIHFNFLNFISLLNFCHSTPLKAFRIYPPDLPIMKNNSPVSPHLMCSLWSIQKTEPHFLQTLNSLEFCDTIDSWFPSFSAYVSFWVQFFLFYSFYQLLNIVCLREMNCF